MKPLIHRVVPSAGMEGGEITISAENFQTGDFRSCRVLFGDVQGRIVSASSGRIIAAVPQVPGTLAQPTDLVLESGGESSDPAPFYAGSLLVDRVHPVTNPAYDVDSGYMYVTFSGSRGQKVPCSVYSISPLGEKSEFLHDVMNATAIAFDREGTMFVTSRFDGVVYRVSPFKEAEAFARELGVCTGLAFDHRGRMFVGDRSGNIFALSEIGEVQPFAQIEPSVSAYHLAYGPDDRLYVTAPTASSNESIYRISPEGAVEEFVTGLGRPQGLAFDTEGQLYVACSHHGHRGVLRITPAGERQMVVASRSAVGLVFDDAGNMVIASTQGELHRIPLAIHGYLNAFW
ncbi:MAG: SMP-30/gluconolactonase/LRE family protein [Acidobacteria bacterium]|nr:SMP-30/gluconolactonase/LRE family protein [Acidobacteriota bacterium]